MDENWAEELKGLSGVKNRLWLSLAKNSNAMFNGLFVGFEIKLKQNLFHEN